MLDIVQDLLATMVLCIMLVSISIVIRMGQGVMAEVFISFVMIIVVISSPVRIPLVIGWVLIATFFA